MSTMVPAADLRPGDVVYLAASMTGYATVATEPEFLPDEVRVVVTMDSGAEFVWPADRLLKVAGPDE